MRSGLFLALYTLSLYANAHIFVFHRFGDTRHPSTNTSIETLRQEFTYLKEHHYEVISLKKLHHALTNGEPINDKWVVFTIDDNFKSFSDNALALFKEFDYPFTLFVYVQATMEHYGDYMSWDAIKEASKYGEIGFHSYAHPHLASLSDAAIISDTKKGLALMQEHLGFTPQYYAYPYGEYTPRVRQIMEDFNFKLIINQNAGAVDHQSNAMDLDRIALTGQNTLKQKLRIKTLPTTWIYPKVWPKNSTITSLKATLPHEVKNLEYYISGEGWTRTTLHHGNLDVKLNKKLRFKRTRIFLKDGNRQSSIILVKEKK